MLLNLQREGNVSSASMYFRPCCSVLPSTSLSLHMLSYIKKKSAPALKTLKDFQLYLIQALHYLLLLFCWAGQCDCKNSCLGDRNTLPWLVIARALNRQGPACPSQCLCPGHVSLVLCVCEVHCSQDTRLLYSQMNAFNFSLFCLWVSGQKISMQWTHNKVAMISWSHYYPFRQYFHGSLAVWQISVFYFL